MWRKLNKKEYIVGQEVILKLNGKDNAYIKGCIAKITTKLMTIEVTKGEFSKVIKINMESGFEHTDYTPNYNLFDSEQHFNDYIEAEDIINVIRKSIGTYGTPHIDINKLREIKRILELD